MLSRLIVGLMVTVLVLGMYQAMSQKPHTCKACAQLYMEVTK